jgi:PP-loop superfamily ATP-utilizing enzyme
MVAVVSALTANVQTAMSVPVVPNFTQGSMTSNTETTSTVTETINSMSYKTGYDYVISGTNIEHDGDTISAPSTTGNSNTLNGVTSTWTGLDLENKPNFTISNQGGAFQFTESYTGPGLSNHTIIQRETTINSVTNTTSVFSN